MQQFGKIPDFIENAPELRPWLVHYYEAFIELNTDRPPSLNGASSIPWASITAYGKHHEYEGEEFDRLHFMVRGMDNALLAHLSEKSKKSQPAPPAPPKTPTT